MNSVRTDTATPVELQAASEPLPMNIPLDKHFIKLQYRRTEPGLDQSLADLL